jgi:uncharacterized protein YjiS (DUF1127 family)
MSTLTHSIVHTTALQRFVHAVVASLRTTAAAWQRARRQRAAMRAMEALDDRTLADIGFARCEIGSVAAELIGATRATRRQVMQA